MPGGRVEAYEVQPQHHDTRGIGVQRLARQPSSNWFNEKFFSMSGQIYLKQGFKFSNNIEGDDLNVNRYL